MRSGSGAGMDGVRPIHLQQMLANVDNIKILIKVDVKNTFNSLHRSNFLTIILDRCPQAYSFMHHTSTPLYYGRDEILFQTGLQQGNPMAPISFTLAI